MDLEEPALKYIVLESGDKGMQCLTPGKTALVYPDKPLKLADINTNVNQNSGVKAFLTGDGSFRRLISINTPVVLSGLQQFRNDKTACFKIEVERDNIILGSIGLKLLQEMQNGG